MCIYSFKQPISQKLNVEKCGHYQLLFKKTTRANTFKIGQEVSTIMFIAMD